jgi:hypothetical protein
MSEELFSAAEVNRALHRVAVKLQLRWRALSRCSRSWWRRRIHRSIAAAAAFPLDFDTIHATRYGDKTQRAVELEAAAA